MRVAAEIVEHLLRAAKRALGVNHPFDLAQGPQMVGEGSWLGEPGQLSEETQHPGIEDRLQAFQEQPAIKPREYPDRKEKADRQAIQRPSGDRPPPGTMQWMCGWWNRFCPQMCSTAVMPIAAPRCLGSAARVCTDSAATRNKMS